MVTTVETPRDPGEDLTAAYIPLKTFLTSITVFNEGLPPTLDRSAWPSFSNIVKGQVMGAYKFLGLVDRNGTVQPILKELVGKNLDTAEGKEVLARVLKDHYPKIMELATQTATPGSFQEEMRKLNVTGSTLEKAIRFWVDAAGLVGIKYPSSWQKIPRSSTGSAKKKKVNLAGQIVDDGDGEEVDGEEGESSKRQGRMVQLPGATVTLIATTTDLHNLLAHPEELKWLQELIAKFDEKAEAE